MCLGDRNLTLRCEEVSKSFGGIRALRQVSVEFPSRGITAIIGPNGAGKTTLIDVLTGFTTADTGRCYLGNTETTAMRPYQTARLGVARTFQELGIIRQESVIANVMLAFPHQKGETLVGSITRFGVRRQEAYNRDSAVSVLQRVGLESKLQDRAGELSYGEQKLLALARCVATGAPVLLLDEPVAGVHPEMAEQIVSIMNALIDEGRGIIFIEHNIGVVRQAAERIIVMDRGSVVAEGIPQEVLARPEIMEAYVG